VPGVDDRDALRATPVVHGEQVSAGQREQILDAMGSEPLRHEAPAVQLLGGLLDRRLGGHSYFS
jgi:hypothetical protein